MTEHKFTDEEVIRALECCNRNGSCSKCPYDRARFEYETDCASEMTADALDLINRQRGEIERMEEKNIENERFLNVRVMESVNAVSEAHRKYERALEECIKSTKAEAVKEFADRLKTYYRNLDTTAGGLVEYHIDQVVKEFLGKGGGYDA